MAKKKKKSKASAGVVVQRPGWNVYTSLLMISLFAVIIACFCLFKEMDGYDWDIQAKKAPRVSQMQTTADLTTSRLA
jgi:hypothetical protein